MTGRRSLLVAIALFAVGCAPESSRSALLEGASITPRGHQELVLRDGQPPLPLVLGEGNDIGMCLEVPPTTDTSQWEARLWFGKRSERDQPYRSPDVRLGTNLCFDVTPAPHLTRNDTLCGELRDGYDGTTAELPCVPFRYEPDDAAYRELRSSIGSVLAGRDASDELVADLDAMGAQARARGFPLLELRFELISVYMLRRMGTDDALASADRRLASAPAWLDSRAANAWVAHVAYERATLALASGSRLEDAWEHLRTAEAHYLSVADSKLVTVVMKQSEILARIGALHEARERLRLAVDRCNEVPCEPTLVPAAKNTLAWLLLQDPDADKDELAEAERILQQVAAGRSDAMSALEQANVLINRAYGQARQGNDPRAALAGLSRLLQSAEADDSERARWLDSWKLLVEATYLLEQGRTEKALSLCRHVAETANAPRLIAWGLSCGARAHRALGELDQAGAMLERALFLHEHSGSSRLGQSIALGPGQRANDFYRAARVAAEQGHADRAWSILRDLDGLTERESANPACGEAANAELERRHEALLLQLVALDAPASGARRAQREEIRRSLMERLQDLVRRNPDCATGPPATSADASVDFRAIALEDEILVLRQRRDGELSLYRRTPLAREELLATTREIDRVLERREPIAEASWAATVAPLARALVPRREDLHEVTTFALHGALQQIPLSALPVNAVDTGEDPRWLSELTVVALRPSGAVSPMSGREAQRQAPLFVVDPAGNLAEGAALAAFYRETFPRARVLEGREATVAAFRQHVGAAGLLHVDAHARYDPAFPELTKLELADGPLPARQLGTSLPVLGLANLSACQSGSWPVTADSGRFGLAGLLARRGVPWVIGTRADLDDKLAAGFNREFYRALADGRAVPVAYRRALERVRESHPVSRWAAILLLRADRETQGGQWVQSRTPVTSRGSER